MDQLLCGVWSVVNLVVCDVVLCGVVWCVGWGYKGPTIGSWPKCRIMLWSPGEALLEELTSLPCPCPTPCPSPCPCPWLWCKDGWGMQMLGVLGADVEVEARMDIEEYSWGGGGFVDTMEGGRSRSWLSSSCRQWASRSVNDMANWWSVSLSCGSHAVIITPSTSRRALV